MVLCWHFEGVQCLVDDAKVRKSSETTPTTENLNAIFYNDYGWGLLV